MKVCIFIESLLLSELTARCIIPVHQEGDCQKAFHEDLHFFMAK